MTTLLILAATFILLAFVSIFIYNNLVKQRNLVQEAWSIIDVMLKKRYDLIPNLVEIVKGYASHEKETLENVVAARNNAQKATDVDHKKLAEQNLNQAMMNLFAVAESYPNLKANANFQQLQTDLTVLETDLEKSRRYYNGAVRVYNTTVESFPNNIFANMFRFVKSTFFELDNPIERQNPQIKF